MSVNHITLCPDVLVCAIACLSETMRESKFELDVEIFTQNLRNRFQVIVMNKPWVVWDGKVLFMNTVWNAGLEMLHY